MWADFKFPPINLYNINPLPEMIALHAETQDPSLWDEDLNKEQEYEKFDS